MDLTVFSGGQTGVDQAAWRAARRCGLETGGMMPRGFKTEEGGRGEFARLYGAVESPSGHYPGRTMANVVASDLTLWYGPVGSKGFHLTRRTAWDLNKPFWVAEEHGGPADLARDIRLFGRCRILNVAGSRESLQPGIGAEAEEYLFDLFTRLKEGE